MALSTEDGAHSSARGADQHVVLSPPPRPRLKCNVCKGKDAECLLTEEVAPRYWLVHRLCNFHLNTRLTSLLYDGMAIKQIDIEAL